MRRFCEAPGSAASAISSGQDVATDQTAAEAPGDLWVFGYGSLMWNPGFPYVERRVALLRGTHRRLCVRSTRYRGTPDAPGLVLGLDRGGACRGIAFRVSAADVPATRAYLEQRERVTKVYHEVFRTVTLDDGRRIKALAYVVDRSHAQYTGELSREEQLQRVRAACGNLGPNADYVRNTADHLNGIGFRDETLAWICERL